MTALFWTPGFWIAGCASAVAIIVTFFTEKYETRRPRRAAKRRAA